MGPIPHHPSPSEQICSKGHGVRSWRVAFFFIVERLPRRPTNHLYHLLFLLLSYGKMYKNSLLIDLLAIKNTIKKENYYFYIFHLP